MNFHQGVPGVRTGQRKMAPVMVEHPGPVIGFTFIVKVDVDENEVHQRLRQILAGVFEGKDFRVKKLAVQQFEVYIRPTNCTVDSPKCKPFLSDLEAICGGKNRLNFGTNDNKEKICIIRYSGPAQSEDEFKIYLQQKLKTKDVEFEVLLFSWDLERHFLVESFGQMSTDQYKYIITRPMREGPFGGNIRLRQDNGDERDPTTGAFVNRKNEGKPRWHNGLFKVASEVGNIAEL